MIEIVAKGDGDSTRYIRVRAGAAAIVCAACVLIFLITTCILLYRTGEEPTFVELLLVYMTEQHKETPKESRVPYIQTVKAFRVAYPDWSVDMSTHKDGWETIFKCSINDGHIVKAAAYNSSSKEAFGEALKQLGYDL